MRDASNGQEVGNGIVYGAMCSMIRGWMMESPRWAEISGKIEFVIGGHIGSEFGGQAFIRFPEARYITIAQYNGGWDAGTDLAAEDGVTYERILRFQGGPAAYEAREATISAAVSAAGKTLGVDVFHDIYEAGPGYQLNGMNNVSVNEWQANDQEAVQKSRASAAAQLDAICASWQRGWVSNFFMLGRGDGWKSHSDQWSEFLTYTVGRVLGEALGQFRAHEIHPIEMPVSQGVNDIGLYAFESITHPGRWIFSAINRVIDRTVLEPDDPMHDPEDAGTRSITIRTHLAGMASCRVFLGGIGNMREHDRWAPGTRIGLDAGKKPVVLDEPLSVRFDTGWHDRPILDLSRLVIDDALGADPGGLRGGNFIMVMVE